MNRYILIAVIAGIFGVGILVGAYGNYLMQMNHMQTMMSGMGGMSGMGSMSGGMGGMSGMGSMSGMSRHGAFLVPGSVHQLCHQDSTMSPAYCEPHYQVMSSIPGVRISHIHPVDNTTLEVTLTTTNSAKSTINQGTTVFVGNDYLFGSANVPSGWKDKTTVNVPLKGMGIVYDYESMHGHLLATTGTSMDNMAHP